MKNSHVLFLLLLGRAIDYAVQHAMTEANGGRPTAVKIAVVLVSERSEDPVDAAARSANGNSKY